MSTVSEMLVKAVRDAVVHNPDVQVAPACILWPDKDRQWEAVIPRLQGEMEELLILSDYAPERRTGPAIWLRCVIAGLANEVPFPTVTRPSSDVGQDNDTKHAMQLALYRLLDEDTDLLKGKRLDKDYFNNLPSESRVSLLPRSG